LENFSSLEKLFCTIAKDEIGQKSWHLQGGILVENTKNCFGTLHYATVWCRKLFIQDIQKIILAKKK